MRLFCFMLLAAFLCTLTPHLHAADYQPSTQEWADLMNMAPNAQVGYSNLVMEYERLVKESKERPDDGFSPIGAPMPVRPTAAQLEALLEGAKKMTASLKKLSDEMKALKPKDRSRALYLKYLRPVKSASYQYTLEWQHRYRMPAAGKLDISGMEQEIIHAMNAARVAPAPLPEGLQLSLANFPRLDGSTTAQPLSTLLTCRFLGLWAEWRVRQIYDARNSEGTEELILIPAIGEPPLLVNTNQNESFFPGLQLNMVHSGTSNAYCNLVAGAADIILVARPPSPDELALAKEKNVEYELNPVGYDAFIFMLHQNNPVNSLMVKQLQDIYSDNILNWSEVGGKSHRVIAFQRERNSGSQETMAALVMQNQEMAPPLSMLIGYGMGGPYNLLTEQEKGIGYTFYYYHTRTITRESDASR